MKSLTVSTEDQKVILTIDNKIEHISFKGVIQLADQLSKAHEVLIRQKRNDANFDFGYGSIQSNLTAPETAAIIFLLNIKLLSLGTREGWNSDSGKKLLTLIYDSLYNLKECHIIFENIFGRQSIGRERYCILELYKEYDNIIHDLLPELEQF
jgi:hypothetical protein